MQNAKRSISTKVKMQRRAERFGNNQNEEPSAEKK